ncbi:MAG: hypothetical protein K1X56_08580 [Flavobacteriales bacterium]|nr:hypothetical protein [Flavobacteriales bacterium]
MLGSFHASRAQYFGCADLMLRMIFSWEEGGYELKYTYFNDEPAYLHGIRGGWYMDGEEKWVLGFSSYFASTVINESFSLLNRQQLVTMYSTVYVDYTFFQDKPVQLNPLLHLGYGFAELTDLGFGSTGSEYSGYYLVEPNINATIKVFRYMKFGLGLGYRAVGGVRMQGADSYSLSGLSMNAFIKFGDFGD